MRFVLSLALALFAFMVPGCSGSVSELDGKDVGIVSMEKIDLDDKSPRDFLPDKSSMLLREWDNGNVTWYSLCPVSLDMDEISPEEAERYTYKLCKGDEASIGEERVSVGTYEGDIIVSRNGRKKRATQSERVNERYPSISPDGKKIVFESESDIWIMNLDGSGLRNLTLSEEKEEEPTWVEENRIFFLSKGRVLGKRVDYACSAKLGRLPGVRGELAKTSPDGWVYLSDVESSMFDYDRGNLQETTLAYLFGCYGGDSNLIGELMGNPKLGKVIAGGMKKTAEEMVGNKEASYRISRIEPIGKLVGLEGRIYAEANRYPRACVRFTMRLGEEESEGALYMFKRREGWIVYRTE